MVLGINNRDLTTFETSLETTQNLATVVRRELSSHSLPPFKMVSESGIFSAEDLVTLAGFGAQAYLIGESLVAEGDPGANLAEMISQFNAMRCDV